MTALLLVIFFTLVAGVAFGSLAISVRRYGKMLWTVGCELDRCCELRDYRITTRTIDIRPEGAAILRPRFTRSLVGVALREAA